MTNSRKNLRKSKNQLVATFSKDSLVSYESEPSTSTYRSTEAETHAEQKPIATDVACFLPDAKEVSKQKLDECNDWNPSDPGQWPYPLKNSDRERIQREQLGKVLHKLTLEQSNCL